MKDETLEVAVLFQSAPNIKPYTGNMFATYQLPFVTINENHEVRNISSGTYSNLVQYSDLYFHMIVDWEKKWDISSPYSFHCEYQNVDSVDLYRAKHMAAMLRKIQKITSNFSIKPTSFGQYVLMIAQKLKIKTFVKLDGPATGWHTTSNYKFHDIAYIQEHIDSSLEEAKKKFRPDLVQV